MNLSATTDLPSLKVEYVIISLPDNHFLKTRDYKILLLGLPIFHLAFY